MRKQIAQSISESIFTNFQIRIFFTLTFTRFPLYAHLAKEIGNLTRFWISCVGHLVLFLPKNLGDRVYVCSGIDFASVSTNCRLDFGICSVSAVFFSFLILFDVQSGDYERVIFLMLWLFLIREESLVWRYQMGPIK